MIAWSVNWLSEVGSTQDAIRELAARGAPEGTVVVAKRQTAGRGRHGRTWFSPEGGLYMSLLLRPSSSERLRALTVLSSLAVARGIEKAVGLNVRLRWPNDVMLGDRKVAGVIAESSYQGGKVSFATVGIGVNCNSTVPDSLGEATNIAQALGRQVDIAALAKSIMEAFGTAYEEWRSGRDMSEAVRAVTGTTGRRVVVTTSSGETFQGTAEAVDPDGGLVLVQNGRKTTFHAENVERLSES